MDRAHGPAGSLNNKPLYAWPASDLPMEARRTLARWAHGGRMPFPKDGKRFDNRDRDLPVGRSYFEFTVASPDSPRSGGNRRKDRGCNRFVIDNKGIVYFTPAHYDRAPKGVRDPEAKRRLVDQLPRELQHGFYVVTMPPTLRRKVAGRMTTLAIPADRQPAPRKQLTPPTRPPGAEAPHAPGSVHATTAPPLTPSEKAMATSKTSVSQNFNAAAAPKKPAPVTPKFNAAAAPQKPAQFSSPQPQPKPPGGPNGPAPGTPIRQAAPPVRSQPVAKKPEAPKQGLTPKFNAASKGPKR
ncbi:MAG: ribonuclease domain-containing protein [Pseudomonadota bacterium]